MKNNFKKLNISNNINTMAILGLALILGLGSTTLAGDTADSARKNVDSAIVGNLWSGITQSDEKRSIGDLQPVYRKYRNVELGMLQEKVREILGDPSEKGNIQDFFRFSDGEMSQVFYDEKSKVRAISTTYTENLEKAPTAVSVLGEETPAAEEGTVYKLVRYPAFGYWVSYNRTVGKHATVTVTMQRL